MRKSIFIAILLLFGCKSQIDPIKPPKNLIPRDTMKLVLTKMTLLECYIENKFSSQLLQYQNVMGKSGDSLLGEFHISYKRFKSSMMYYVQNQGAIDSIYVEIMDSLTVRKAKLSVD
jgi:hypothetical protein